MFFPKTNFPPKTKQKSKKIFHSNSICCVRFICWKEWVNACVNCKKYREGKMLERKLHLLLWKWKNNKGKSNASFFMFFAMLRKVFHYNLEEVVFSKFPIATQQKTSKLWIYNCVRDVQFFPFSFSLLLIAHSMTNIQNKHYLHLLRNWSTAEAISDHVIFLPLSFP